LYYVKRSGAGLHTSYDGRSIYRRRRESRKTTRGNDVFVRESNIGFARSCECGYRCPWRAGHSPDDHRTESLRLHGRQQSCRKRRGAHFFCIGDVPRIEMDAFGSPRRITPVAR